MCQDSRVEWVLSLITPLDILQSENIAVSSPESPKAG